MTSDWTRVRLDELVDSDSPITYGVVKPGPEDPEGVLFVRGGDIADGRINLEALRTITQEVSRQYQRTLLRGGEILISLVGNPGESAIVPPELAGANIARQVGLIRLTPAVNTSYVKYFLMSHAGREALGTLSYGSVQSVINLRDLRTVKIPLPSRPVQDAIAHILGTLDDKIELNRQLNHTLEAIARAIFKSWFVDFDPVWANMEGRHYPLDPATLALFPDTFEDSELGEIPAGWSTCFVGDVVEIIKGRSYKSSELEPSNTALVTLKSIERGGGYKPEGLKSYTGDFRPEQEVKPGEIVLAYTDLTQKAEVIGKPAIVRPSPQYEVLVASLDLAVVRPTTRELSIPFLYELFMTPDFQSHVYGYTNGSTVLHLSKTGVPSYEFVRPPEAVIGGFTQLVGALFEKIELNHAEVATLADLRDTLLPKLISGELRVPAAAELIEEVAQ